MTTEERIQLARDYFRKGYNCSQSVVLAFQDVIGADCTTLESLSIGLGGGVGRMREVCGAVSGMAMVAGFLSETPADADNHSRKLTVYKTVQELAGQFSKENGSIICRELLGLRADAATSPVPQKRDESYYKSRPCEAMVACAARLLSEALSAEI